MTTITDTPVLATRSVYKAFGGLKAVNHVSVDIHEGELVGLIGPNGSGKTTLLNMLSALLSPDSGEILLDGHPVQNIKADALARRGVARMFQLTRVFRQMSVLDNLMTSGFAQGIQTAQARERAETLLRELKLIDLINLDAGSLSGGQQKLLEFGSCFMSSPRVALLDEPFAAIHPTMKETMSEFIIKRHREGQTFVVVSHDMPIVSELCKRSICMNAGEVICDGSTTDVLNNPVVIEAYLGDASSGEAH